MGRTSDSLLGMVDMEPYADERSLVAGRHKRKRAQGVGRTERLKAVGNQISPHGIGYNALRYRLDKEYDTMTTLKLYDLDRSGNCCELSGAWVSESRDEA
jgi:hypothetical protein